MTTSRGVETLSASNFRLPRECQVFGPVGRDEPAIEAAKHAELPTMLMCGGRALTPRSMQLGADGKLDLAPVIGATGEAAGGIGAYVFIPFTLTAADKLVFGFGADWWFTAYVDGKEAATNEPEGNVPPYPPIAYPPSRDHYLTPALELAKGTHVLAIRFRSGSASSVLMVGDPAALNRPPAGMTSRERFVNTLTCRPVDRIPNFEIGLWGQTRERWFGEGMPASVGHILLEGNQYFRLDGAVGTSINAANPVPPFEYRVLEETPEWLIFVDERGRTRQGLKENGKYTSVCMDHYIEFPVKDRASFLEMRKRYDGDPSARYPAKPEWNRFADWSRRLEKPFCLNCLYGDFGFYSMLRDWCGTEGVSLLFYDDPALIHECLEFLEDYIFKLYTRALREARFDYIVIHEDLAGKGGPLIGPELFREFLLPHYRRYVSMLKKNGIQVVLVDTDGDFEALIPLFLEVGVDGFTPMEVAAGMDPVVMRKKYGKSFCMMGGVDKREIAKGPAAIDRLLARLAPVVAEGGYIPFIDHSIPPDISLANFEYYLEQKRKILSGQFVGRNA